MFDDDWDEQWFEKRLAGREDVFQHVAELCKRLECGTVLDVGGGTGLMKRFMPPKIRLDVVDISAKAKQYGEPMFSDVKFITGSLWDIPADSSYDAVIALSVIEHMKQYTSFLKLAWWKAKKVVMVSFHNGLNDTERFRYFGGRMGNYMENKYSLPKMMDWIEWKLHPAHVEIHEIEIERDYSPEPILVIYKERVSA